MGKFFVPSFDEFKHHRHSWVRKTALIMQLIKAQCFTPLFNKMLAGYQNE